MPDPEHTQGEFKDTRPRPHPHECHTQTQWLCSCSHYVPIYMNGNAQRGMHGTPVHPRAGKPDLARGTDVIDQCEQGLSH